MSTSRTNRAFLLLRYTLIVATAYLLLVEGGFQRPPLGVILLIVGALASNVVLAQLSEELTSTLPFALGVVLGDTTWITIVLINSGRFNAEFFYLYFFILLLAAIGENLRLIAIGAVVVCMAYVYLLMANGGTWSLWDSPSLIRIPFLFTVAAFYGYMVERTRTERRRAEVGETGRQQAEEELRDKNVELQEQAEVSAALARIGHELISSLDTPVTLERLCQLTAEELAAR
jgi:K+-sensing histidine kinase KdpD